MVVPFGFQSLVVCVLLPLLFYAYCFPFFLGFWEVSALFVGLHLEQAVLLPGLLYLGWGVVLVADYFEGGAHLDALGFCVLEDWGLLLLEGWEAVPHLPAVGAVQEFYALHYVLATWGIQLKGLTWSLLPLGPTI